jgi:hypothetical protein
MTFKGQVKRVIFSSAALRLQLLAIIVFGIPLNIFAQAAPSVVCSNNVRTDRNVYSEPPLPPLPAAGGKFCDPTFGTEIMRVTDASLCAHCGTNYSIVPTFNSNNTRILVSEDDGDSFVLDFNPQDFTLLGNKRYLPAAVRHNFAQWSNTEPNIIYAVSRACSEPKLFRVNVNTSPMTVTLVKDFTGVAGFLPDDFFDRLTISSDDNVFSMVHKTACGANKGVLVYKKSTDQILLNDTNPVINGRGYYKWELDKTGTFITSTAEGPPDNAGFRLMVRNVTTGTNTGITFGAPDYSHGHADYATGVVVGIEGTWNNQVVKRNLSSPNPFSVMLQFNDWLQETHLSLRSNDESWALISSQTANGCGTRNSDLSNEIYLVKTDGSQSIRRLAHNRTVLAERVNGQSVNAQYFRSARANISRDGKYIAFTSSWGTTSRWDLFVVKVPTINKSKVADFDGDSKTDISVFRSSDNVWYLQRSSAGYSTAQFGQNGDKIVPSDYDGDGKTDIAVYRSGVWHILQSSNSTIIQVSFGLGTDIPAPGDFDGDGKSDQAVFRPSNGTWYLQQSSLGFGAFQFGVSGDIPVVGDYDGDGKSDAAVFRPNIGDWFILRSTSGFHASDFGLGTDKVIPADYTGDGKTDIAVWRPSTGTWYVLTSESGFTSYYGWQFGTNGDTPAPGDYDGDGKADLAVFRHSVGTWFVSQSSNGSLLSQQFGANGDIPVPSAYIP